jgi:hypothetical protein
MKMFVCYIFEVTGPTELNVTKPTLLLGSAETWEINASLRLNSFGQFSVCVKVHERALHQNASFSCLTIIMGREKMLVNASSLQPSTGATIVPSSLDALFKQRFSFSFTSNAFRSNRSAFLRVFSALTAIEVFALASRSADFSTPSGDVSFELPLGLFPDGDYYILLDYGYTLSPSSLYL